MPHTRKTTPLIAALAFVCAALCLPYSACVEDWEDQPSMWTPRDTLSLSPAWTEERDPAILRNMRSSLSDAILQQRDTVVQAPSYDLLEGEGPTRVSHILDRDLEEHGEPPLLVSSASWSTSTTSARSCPLTHEDLDPLRPPTTLSPLDATRWTLSDTLQPLAAPESFARAVQWSKRCLTSTSNTHLQHFTLVSAPSEPFLLRVWPDMGVVTINPLFFTLFQPDPTPNPSPSLRTRHFASSVDGLSDLDDCVESVRTYCESCATEQDVRNNRDCTDDENTLFEGSDPVQDCRTIRYETTNGFLRYCIHQALQERNGVASCIARTTATESNQPIPAYCGGGDPVESASQLPSAFGGFIDPSTSGVCLDALGSCIDSPFPSNPNPPAPIEEDNPCGCGGDE